jgi:hypothetical protein
MPTWKDAAAAVFDSSSDSMASDNNDNTGSSYNSGSSPDSTDTEATSATLYSPPRTISADTPTVPIPTTPTIHGHHHSTHTQNTDINSPIHLTLSPIQHHLNEHTNYTQFGCLNTTPPHYPNTQTINDHNTHHQYISILNDTYNHIITIIECTHKTHI